MLSFLALAKGGVRGIVRDTNGHPIGNASIIINEGKTMYSTPSGEYWRLLTPGEHIVCSHSYIQSHYGSLDNSCERIL